MNPDERPDHIISVTAEIIAWSVPRCSSNCIIRNALELATGLDWRVGCETAWVRGSPACDDWVLPEDVYAKRLAFDNNKRLAPFTFALPWRFGGRLCDPTPTN